MYYLRVRDGFEAAHKLGKGYRGKCSNIHGHSYKVEVVWKFVKLDNKDMAKDFSFLKNLLKGIVGRLDHQNLNDLEFFVYDSNKESDNPTVEKIAQVIYNYLVRESEDKDIGCLYEVTVWETEDNGCTYSMSEL